MSDPRLPPDEVARLHRRADELLPLGSLLTDGGDAPQAWAEALHALADRLGASYPFADPGYLGQMLKPPHPVAWSAYAMAMLLNPNNHALDGGPATAHLEREAVAAIAAMLGYREHLGHLTASGTWANLEALWAARSLHPDRAVVSGANAHYTHARICEVVGARHEGLPQTADGALDLDALAARLAAGGVGTVVATLGTTALGRLDPVHRIADLCAAHGARLHVDAAYGGFFALLADGGTPGVDPEPFAALARADSIAIDPHKHGLQPYGCGCILFRDPGVGALYRHDSPYTYFTSDELHPGEVSLECSRSGAAAAALWATLRAVPLTRDGLGAHLAVARAAAVSLAAHLDGLDGWRAVTAPDLDIVCWHRDLPTASAISAAADADFDALARAGWHVAKLRVDPAMLGVEADLTTATVLRATLMKPVHAAMVEPLAEALAAL
ncbi:MAG: pyridoxal phosphate-dependent decarboxylase family protein [Actinomycetota bacterium]